MAKEEKPDRETDTEIFTGAAERQDEIVRRWIDRPEIKAALYRHQRPLSRRKAAG